MCGRFTGLTFDEIRDVIGLLERDAGFDVWDDWAVEHPDERLDGSTDAFPGRAANLIVPSGAAAGMGARAMEPACMTWGYAVDWQKQPLFNTRIEKALAGGGVWGASLERRRCVVPALAFFEPHATETAVSPRTGKPVKRPYRFAMPGGAPVLLAGVWQDDRFSVVTTEPNAWVSPVHARMPLVLRPAEVPLWLWGAREEYARLADRAGVELAVEPLGETAAPGDSQLSLF